MAHTLEFLIVLASMASTVIRFGSGIRTCPKDRYQNFVDQGLECRYELFARVASYNMAHYKVQRHFQRSVYAHVASATVHHTFLVKQVGCDELPTVVDNATVSWEYKCDVAAVANIVPDEPSEVFKIQPGSCQVYAFTIEERWDRECEIRDNIRKNIKYTMVYKNVDGIDVPENIRMEVRDLALSSFKDHICNRMDEDLHVVSNLTKNTSPLPLKVTINDAIDKSLTRFRENIANHRAENIELKNIHFPVYVSDGNFKGHVVFTGGIFEDFSTIERVGDAFATIQADMYNIRSTFTIRQARVYFDSYHFQPDEVSSNDTISLIIQNSRIQLEHSGFLDSGVCIESVWVNITTMSAIMNQFPNFNPDTSIQSNASIGIFPTRQVEMKEMLGSHLAWNLQRYGIVDYTNYIYGPCMSNSSKIWRHAYTSRTDFQFT